MIKLTPAAKATIRANSFKSAREIAELILQKHGIVVSQAYIKTIIKGSESKTADTTELVISEIENNIAEFVNDKTKEYLISLEDNIRNIEERLAEPGLPNDEFIKLSKLLSDQVKSLLSMKGNENINSYGNRPNVNVNVSLDNLLDSYAKYKADNNNKQEIKNAEYKLL
ncbi:MAG: helix-turn-helix domain-containing protein [Vulcanibacillus sp.]